VVRRTLRPRRLLRAQVTRRCTQQSIEEREGPPPLLTVRLLMRALATAILIAISAASAHAQQSLPSFDFYGHHIGDTAIVGAPWSRCTEEAKAGMAWCTRERELLDNVSFQAGYGYAGGRLARIALSADAANFDTVLRIFTKRFGQARTVTRGRGHAYAQWRFREGRLHLTRTGEVIVARFDPIG
jgi:hypothetical protein